MTKYTQASARRAVNAKPDVNPIWRGIGCIMMVVIPVISYLLSLFIVNMGVAQNWPMPYQLMGYPVLPPLFSKSDALLPIVLWIQQQQNLYAILLLTIAFIVVIGGFVIWLYTAIYAQVGPPRYGPLDEPPIRGRVKRYKR